MALTVTPSVVEENYEWVADRVPRLAALINDVRASLGEAFDTEVGRVTKPALRTEVDAVFADGDAAVNAAAIVAILRGLDVENDHPGFVLDEVLGRELAAVIAGGQPRSMLAEATFHYADIMTHGDPSDNAGLDDLDAALAAGFQTRLPGWQWTEATNPFGVDT